MKCVRFEVNGCRRKILGLWFKIKKGEREKCITSMFVLVMELVFSISPLPEIIIHLIIILESLFYPCSFCWFSAVGFPPFFRTYVAPWEFSSASTSTFKDIVSEEGKCLLRLVQGKSLGITIQINKSKRMVWIVKQPTWRWIKKIIRRTGR